MRSHRIMKGLTSCTLGALVIATAWWLALQSPRDPAFEMPKTHSEPVWEDASTSFGETQLGVLSISLPDTAWPSPELLFTPDEWQAVRRAADEANASVFEFVRDRVLSERPQPENSESPMG